MMSVRDPQFQSRQGIEACGTADASRDGAAKTEIFTFLRQLANAGVATLSTLETGEIEARFVTGEVFRLGASHITRVDGMDAAEHELHFGKARSAPPNITPAALRFRKAARGTT